MKKKILWTIVILVVALGGYAYYEYSQVQKLQAAVEAAEAVVVEKAVLAETATPEEVAAAEAAYLEAVAAQAQVVVDAQAALDAKLQKAPVSWFVCAEKAECTAEECKDCAEKATCTEAQPAEAQPEVK